MKYAIAIVMLLAACGKKSDDGKVASCFSESIHSCVEYRGGNLALGTENLAKLCTAVVSTSKFSETPCPTANLLGSCQRDEGKDFFYQGYEGDPEIEKSCTSRGGKFAK